MTLYLTLGIVGIVLVLLSLVVADLLDGVMDALEADWISTAVIGGFVSAFGFGGAAADGAGLPWPASVAIGGAAGLACGYFAWWLTRLLKDGPSDGTVSIADSVGQVGRVLTDIPSSGFGVVRVVVGGHTLQVNASSDLPIPSGAEVDVTGVLSPTAVTVMPVWKP